MKRAVAVAAGAFALWFVAGTAHADLKSAQQKYLHGDYAGARADLERLSGKEAQSGRLVLARVHMRTGKYAEAEKLARALSKANDPAIATDGHVLLAEVLRATGRYADARREVEPVVARQPNARRARYVLGLLLRDVGDARADAEWKKFLQEFDGNKLDLNDPPTLFYLAGRRATPPTSFATALREAGHRDRRCTMPHRVGLPVHRQVRPPTPSELDEVLKNLPAHPDAHAGCRGQAGAELRPAAATTIARAPSHPAHVPARSCSPRRDRSHGTRRRRPWEVFAVTRRLEARSLLAPSLASLRHRAYDRREQCLPSPDLRRFYHIVARSAVREHRYREAIELEREAVTLRPTYYEAMEAIGAGYLRLGMEKEGLEWLRKAWKGDQYNMRTKNTLDLFEDFIPREYSFATSKSFKLRYHNDEKALYRRYIEPLLEQAFGDMVKRYVQRRRLVLELFQNAHHYSVAQSDSQHGALGTDSDRSNRMSPRWATSMGHGPCGTSSARVAIHLPTRECRAVH